MSLNIEGKNALELFGVTKERFEEILNQLSLEGKGVLLATADVVESEDLTLNEKFVVVFQISSNFTQQVMINDAKKEADKQMKALGLNSPVIY